MKLIWEAFEKILRSSENFWGGSVHKTQMKDKSFYPEAALLHLKEQKKQKKNNSEMEILFPFLERSFATLSSISFIPKK